MIVGYLSEVLIAVNLVLRLVPNPLTAAMITSEMPAAIRPYSMAVAPDASAKKALIIFMIQIAQWHLKDLLNRAQKAIKCGS
ncbi:MAG: hypothetical protein JWR77_2650 [Rhizorhabdus sp.]|jgi:hypothetical protein|nr:hypothetical protein [Rhizorhabdus sp.]